MYMFVAHDFVSLSKAVTIKGGNLAVLKIQSAILGRLNQMLSGNLAIQ